MEKKEFKAESKRLLDLMINSIYTHKEIFLREIISNASDAIDKLCYLSLTDDKVGKNRSDFFIQITADKDKRTLTVSDNGIGMDQSELENNLGVIAASGSYQFRKEAGESEDVDIIGQFGVGFYSAFMVSDQVTVRSRKFGEEQGVESGSFNAKGAWNHILCACGQQEYGWQFCAFVDFLQNFQCSVCCTISPADGDDVDGNTSEEFDDFVDVVERACGIDFSVASDDEG